MLQVLKMRNLHIFQYLQKIIGDEVDFLSADKHKGFL